MARKRPIQRSAGSLAMLLFLVATTLTAQQSPPPGNTINTVNTSNAVNSGNTAQTGNSGFHAYLPVNFIYPPDTLGGKIYIPTDGGLFVTDLEGRHLAKFDQSSGLPSSNMTRIFRYSDERRMVITASELQFYGCTFNPFNTTRDTWLYEIHPDSVTVVAALPPYTQLATSDDFGNLWLLVSTFNDFHAVHRMSADSVVTGPYMQNAFRMFRNPDSGQIVITYYESFTQGGVRNVTFNGTDFVPYDGPIFPSWSQPGTYDPGAIRRAIYDAYPDKPREITVQTLRESPDGSLWYLNSVPEIVCVAKDADLSATVQSDNIYRQNEQYEFWMGSIGGGLLQRRTATAIENHATWTQWNRHQPQFSRKNGIASLEVTPSGDPLVGLRNFYGLRDTGVHPSPMAWLYRPEGDVLYSPNTVDVSWYYVTYEITPASDLGYFVYSNRELYWLTQQGVMELALPDSLKPIMKSFGIQPDGLNRWVLHTYNYIARLHLVNGVPEAYEVVPATRELAGFRAQKPDGSVWLAALDRTLRHFGPDGTLLSERPIPGEHPITDILFPASVPTTGAAMAENQKSAALVGDGSHTKLAATATPNASANTLAPGEVWVATCGGGLLRYSVSGAPEELSISQGLASECVIDLHQGPSGNIYLGSMVGYTVFGNPALISGSPRPEIFPSSVDEPNGATSPSALTLHPNWPNPFNPATELRFDLPASGGGGLQRVQLTVYDLLGREVARLVDQTMTTGSYTVRFDAGSLSSGVYLVRLQSNETQVVRKITLLK
jgi:hypothetical protein